MTAAEVRQLLRFIDWMMDLPESLAALFEQELAAYEEEKHMPFITSFERTGIRKGLLAGIKALLRVKYGEPGLELLPEIEQIHDHEKLETILNALETTNTPAELRRLCLSRCFAAGPHG